MIHFIIIWRKNGSILSIAENQRSKGCESCISTFRLLPPSRIWRGRTRNHRLQRHRQWRGCFRAKRWQKPDKTWDLGLQQAETACLNRNPKVRLQKRLWGEVVKNQSPHSNNKVSSSKLPQPQKSSFIA